jgi:endo-1,4-beta-mannosidase
MKMDMKQSINNIDNTNQSQYIDKHRTAAREYACQGLDADLVQELLQVDGCDIETSKKLAGISVESMPDNYIFGDPPTSWYDDDIQYKVMDTIKNSSREKLEKYFQNFADKKYSETINRILLARDNHSEFMFSEVRKELEPLVENLILTARALSDSPDEIKIGEREQLEQELFGVWPAELLKKHARNEKAMNRILLQTKPTDKLPLII